MAQPDRLTSNIDGVSVQRERLHAALIAMEDALAAGAGVAADSWKARVIHALEDLQDAFTLHVTFTESEGGLYDEILAASPRLNKAVTAVREEHPAIAVSLAELDNVFRNSGLSGAEFVNHSRDRGGQVLALLVRHRQRGADLTYSAFEEELGGDG